MKDGMKSAFQRESHSSENSRTLPGYLGEVFSVELGIFESEALRDIATSTQTWMKRDFLTIKKSAMGFTENS